MSDTIGFDIFGVTDFVSDILNAGDVPVALINSMVTAQWQDVSRLAPFLEKEELTGTDLQAMVALMERISDREQEIAAAGGTAGGFGGTEQVAQLAQVWAQNNYQIIKYAEQEAAFQELSEVETELETVRGELAAYQEELSSIQAKTTDFQEICQGDRPLYEM